jgi:hypothetical protein
LTPGSVTLVTIYAKYEPGNNLACSEGVGGCSTAKVIELIIFITFANYWIAEVLKNRIHVTISGVIGHGIFTLRNPGVSPKVLREASLDDLLLAQLDLSVLAVFSLPLSNFSDGLAVSRSKMGPSQGTRWAQSSSVFLDSFLAFELGSKIHQ